MLRPDVRMNTSGELSSDELRDLFPATASRKAFAEALGVCEKTIARMNLPTIYVGGRARIMVAEAREVLLQRRRGRAV